MRRPPAALVLLVVLATGACEGSVEDPTAGPTSAPTSAPSAEPSPSPSPSPHPVVGPPDPARAVRLATLLARDVGPRPAGGDGDVVARLVVTAWLEEAGWQVEQQEFPLPQGGTTANLVARWGERGRDEPHLVVGAHLDTVAGSPGGNDNASGVGALVTLAEELADEADVLPVPVVLVAFGAEEYQPSDPRRHHLGSEHYAERAGADVVAMLSLDMIGHGATTCICWYDAGPRTLADRLGALTGTAGYRVERRGDISDHGPFALRGIPAAFLWTYMEPRWHKPDDTSEHLQEDAVGRATDLAAALVRSVGEADLDGLDPEP